jgi:hypothetical protein
LYSQLYDIVFSLGSAYTVKGPRTVETVQSYLLLVTYVVHPFHGGEEDDFAWTFLCLACRIALDLKLHRRHACAYMRDLP